AHRDMHLHARVKGKLLQRVCIGRVRRGHLQHFLGRVCMNRKDAIAFDDVEAEELRHSRGEVSGIQIYFWNPELTRERMDHGVFVNDPHFNQRSAELPSPLALLGEGRLELKLVDEAGADENFAEAPPLARSRRHRIHSNTPTMTPPYQRSR